MDIGIRVISLYKVGRARKNALEASKLYLRIIRRNKDISGGHHKHSAYVSPFLMPYGYVLQVSSLEESLPVVVRHCLNTVCTLPLVTGSATDLMPFICRLQLGKACGILNIPKQWGDRLLQYLRRHQVICLSFGLSRGLKPKLLEQDNA